MLNDEARKELEKQFYVIIRDSSRFLVSDITLVKLAEFSDEFFTTELAKQGPVSVQDLSDQILAFWANAPVNRDIADRIAAHAIQRLCVQGKPKVWTCLKCGQKVPHWVVENEAHTCPSEQGEPSEELVRDCKEALINASDSDGPCECDTCMALRRLLEAYSHIRPSDSALKAENETLLCDKEGWKIASKEAEKRISELEASRPDPAAIVRDAVESHLAGLDPDTTGIYYGIVGRGAKSHIEQILRAFADSLDKPAQFLPCPLPGCGGVAWTTAVGDRVCVQCEKCGMLGPVEDNATKAIEGWNAISRGDPT